MAIQQLNISGYQPENLGGGYQLIFFGLTNLQWPLVKGINAYGAPILGDNALFVDLNGLFITYTNSYEVKKGIPQWEHKLSLKLPKVSAEKLRASLSTLNEKFVVQYYSLNSEFDQGNVLPHARLIGTPDHSCSISYSEDYGQNPKDYNHTKVEIMAITPGPALHVV